MQASASCSQWQRQRLARRAGRGGAGAGGTRERYRTRSRAFYGFGVAWRGVASCAARLGAAPNEASSAREKLRIESASERAEGVDESRASGVRVRVRVRVRVGYGLCSALWPAG